MIFAIFVPNQMIGSFSTARMKIQMQKHNQIFRQPNITSMPTLRKLALFCKKSNPK